MTRRSLTGNNLKRFHAAHRSNRLEEPERIVGALRLASVEIESRLDFLLIGPPLALLTQTRAISQRSEHVVQIRKSVAGRCGDDQESPVFVLNRRAITMVNGVRVAEVPSRLRNGRLAVAVDFRMRGSSSGIGGAALKSVTDRAPAIHDARRVRVSPSKKVSPAWEHLSTFGVRERRRHWAAGSATWGRRQPDCPAQHWTRVRFSESGGAELPT